MNVSIALCTFNGARYLSEQLQSYVAQTKLPDELVVCDDGSSDETVLLLKRFAETSPFPVRLYINDQTLGSTDNFAKAISLCKGELIYLSDQDDIWHSDKIGAFEAEFERSKDVGLVFSDAVFVHEDRQPFDRSLFELMGFSEDKQDKFRRGDDLRYLLGVNMVIGCASAFRSKYRALISPIPKDIPTVIHDYWIGLVVSAVASSVPIPRRLIEYRQHSGQQTGFRNVLALEPTQKLNLRDRSLFKHDFSRAVTDLSSMFERGVRVKARVLEVFPGQRSKIDQALNEIEQQILHFSKRDEIYRAVTRGERLSIIVGELLGLRYHTYSRGMRSAVKDLFS